ncbi:DUF6489 family protein [Sphingomonas morindae]|uniref:DUF6489 family protein n=1 Tax=Sphingomonas morindae TaxID=1541170 RepID=A0ABY4XBS2_9SPHN|nr:DUF6489 family protein [Sphingomonas morindae]USI74298.1 DUF6489 family protein [Sphingomonas morindae]
MKISVDVDCTPEEARRFMGLPDMSSVHEAYLSRMRQAIEQGLTPDTVQAMMQAWAPMGEAGLNLWRGLFEQIGGGGGSK